MLVERWWVLILDSARMRQRDGGSVVELIEVHVVLLHRLYKLFFFFPEFLGEALG